MRRLTLFVALVLSLSVLAQTNLELANDAIHAEDFESAAYYATRQLEVNPNDADAYFYRSLAYYYQKNLTDAVGDINKAIKCWNKKAKYDISTLYLVQGDLYDEQKKYDLALEAYNRAIKKDKKSAKAYKARGTLYYKLMDYKKAEKDLNQALRLAPPDADLIFIYARLLYSTDRPKDAIELLNAIISDKPTYFKAYLLRAYIYLDAENYKAAIDNFIVYLELTGGDTDFLRFAAKKEYAYALNAVTQRMQAATNPENRAYWYAVRALLYIDNKQYIEAIDDLNNRIIIMADTVMGVFDSYQLAECYKSLEDHETAIGYYTHVINQLERHGEPDAGCYLKRAECYVEVNKLDSAWQDATKTIDLNIKQAHVAYYFRAKIYEKQGNLTAAIDEYNKALQLDTTFYYAMINRGELYLRLGDTDMANADFNHVILHEEETPILAIYALVYTNQYELAESRMEKITNGRELGEEDYYNFACAYSLMNNRQKALENFKKALQKGFRSFKHIAEDTDLDNIRQTEEFQQLIKQYNK